MASGKSLMDTCQLVWSQTEMGSGKSLMDTGDWFGLRPRWVQGKVQWTLVIGLVTDRDGLSEKSHGHWSLIGHRPRWLQGKVSWTLVIDLVTDRDGFREKSHGHWSLVWSQTGMGSAATIH